MLRFLRRWFVKKPEDAFKTRVLQALARVYPKRRFTPSIDADALECEGATYGLYNLRLTAGVGSRSDAEFDALIRSHFALIESSVPATQPADWDSVKSSLRPQLCPVDFLKKLPLAHRPLGGGLIIGVVIDGEKSYRYATSQDLQAWDVGFDDLLIYATANLNEASAGNTPMHFVPGPDRLVAVKTQDGFDAARIVVPEFRSFIGSKLGSPFLFAVPNRDFLICWSHDNSDNFLTMTRERVRSDFQSMPYPLSPEVFEGSRDSIRPWEPKPGLGQG